MILGNLSLALIIVWCVSGIGIFGSLVFQFRAQKRRQKQMMVFTSGAYPPLQRFGLASNTKRSKLQAAPWRKINQVSVGKVSPSKAARLRLLISAILGGLSFLIIASLALGIEQLADWAWVVAAALTIMFVGLMPKIIVSYKMKQRQRQIQEGMPDFIDLLVLCVDAGLSLDAAMARTVVQLKKISPVLSQEIKLTLDEISIFPDRSQAFRNFQRRAGSDLVIYFVLAVNQTTQYGTPLSATLKTLAEEYRRNAMLDLENQASRLPVFLSIPLILFILPPIVSLSVGPGFILMLRGLGG